MEKKEPLRKVDRETEETDAANSRQTKQRAVLILAVVVVLAIGMAMCRKSPEEKRAAAAVLEAKTTGRLVVKSNVTNATIEAEHIISPGDPVNTNVRGTVDEALSGLPPGKYAVTARAEGWPDARGEAVVEAGRTSEVAIDFKGGSLRLDSDPAGATVRRGAAALGKTPLVIPLLPPGECQLTLEYPSWPVVAFKTTIREGGEATGTVRLPHGRLLAESTPPGATVLLAGRALGQTPLTLERFPAGTKKLTLQAKDFPPLEVTVTVEDRGEVKVSPQLGSGFPVLDPAALLRAVWIPDNRDRLSPGFDSETGPFRPQNGIVRNLHRKKLFEFWLRKSYRFSAIVKSYDRASSQVEFAEQTSELSKYRVLAKLSAEARNNQELAAQLVKGATFEFYGRLGEVEEPRWPAKVITFEFSPAEPLR